MPSFQKYMEVIVEFNSFANFLYELNFKLALKKISFLKISSNLIYKISGTSFIILHFIYIELVNILYLPYILTFRGYRSGEFKKEGRIDVISY